MQWAIVDSESFQVLEVIDEEPVADSGQIVLVSSEWAGEYVLPETYWNQDTPATFYEKMEPGFIPLEEPAPAPDQVSLEGRMERLEEINRILMERLGIDPNEFE